MTGQRALGTVAERALRRVQHRWYPASRGWDAGILDFLVTAHARHGALAWLAPDQVVVSGADAITEVLERDVTTFGPCLDDYEPGIGEALGGSLITLDAEPWDIARRIVRRAVGASPVPGRRRRPLTHADVPATLDVIARTAMVDLVLQEHAGVRTAEALDALEVLERARRATDGEFGGDGPGRASVVGAGRRLGHLYARCNDASPAGTVLRSGVPDAPAVITQLLHTGSRTIALTLLWALDRLAGDHATQERCRTDRRATRNVILEAARLYPAYWALARVATTDTVVAGAPIPSGTRLVLNVHGLHREPGWWCRPDEFLPDRWEDPRERPARRHAYLPFGAGPRVCPARGTAMRLTTALLDEVLDQTDVVGAPSTRARATLTGIRPAAAGPAGPLRLVSREP